jgi:hypothetical protein
LSIPACDQSSKSTAVVVLSTSPGDPTDVTHHHHVTSSCDTSNIPNQPTTIDIKPVIEVAIDQVSVLMFLFAHEEKKKKSRHFHAKKSIGFFFLHMSYVITTQSVVETHTHLFILLDVASLFLIVFFLVEL